MTPLEISYACPEIRGNQVRNHWKSGNQALHQKSQFLVNFLKIFMKSKIYVKSLNIFINLIYFAN